MKYIIDISEEAYKAYLENTYYSIDMTALEDALKNGTPLDDVKAEIDQYLFQNEFGLEYRKEVLQILDNIGKAESEDK